MNTRRTFLRNLSSLAFTAPLMAETPKTKNTVCFFTKHLQGLSFDDIASLGAEAGFNGVEAPIRPKGHIEPEKVADELPKFIEALKKQGLEMTIMTSGINEVSKEQHTEEVLRTAAKLGVKRFRMNYYKYDLKLPIWDQLQAVRPKIKDLVALCKEIGIQPMFQNHSGKDYFGAPVWDIFSIMRDYPAADFSFAFDILHATCEGGLSWPLEFNLVKDHIGAAYFKDFKWDGRKQVTVPLGEGQVDPAYGKMLVKTGYTGPISLHLEYLKGDPKDPAMLKGFREAHVRDIKTLNGWLGWA
ncbi:TIM barrel protein [Prosthecobacter sp.]|uniref:sugar phosphate isomerase/epimerase family protein n=1 Tax=Prosthecobacter sp. TaxID=1965333 RepID=UPI0024879354|nr:TIM barrel protein [Prosthecobacter sp.]MDI1311427.1 TIM barrel protein [Prosthecobacter sp.]